MKKTLLFILLPLFTLTSCEDWFDITPKSELKADDFFETEQGMRDALIGIYATMADEKLYGGLMTMTYMDVLGQYYSSIGNTLHSFYYAYNYDYTNSTEEARKDGLWKALYNGIANANSLLEKMEANRSALPEGEYELIRGEALGLRAYLHFDLLRLFAPSPAMSNGLNRPAIPYDDRLTNQLFARLTTAEVLQRIEADLTEARSLLAEVDPYGPHHSDYDLDNLTGIRKGREYRMNYYAVTGVLARVLLYEGSTDSKNQAFTYATEIIDSGLFPLISSADLSGTDQNGFVQENLFALEDVGLEDNIVDIYFNVGNTSSNYLALTGNTLDNIFPASLSMDYRRLWWIETSGSDNLITKYNYSERVPLVKVSEMYLIATETAPNLTEATEYFNQLQYHRGLPNDELTAENIQDKLLAEYAKEFIAEGQTFFAYKRMGMNVTPVTKRVLPDAEAVYVLPIPTENTNFTNQ